MKNNKAQYIILRGPLGVGKTTVAKKLSQALHGVCISIDDILDEYALTDDREDGYISQKSFLQANKIAVEKAQPYVKKNTLVIFEGNFYWKSQIDDLEHHLPFPHHVFTLHAPLNTCIERDQKRKPPHGKDAAEVIYKKVFSFDAGIPIDATKTLDDCVNNIVINIL